MLFAASQPGADFITHRNAYLVESATYEIQIGIFFNVGTALIYDDNLPITYALNGLQTGATTFNEAWNNPHLSKGSLYLDPGTYDLGIKAVRVASGVTPDAWGGNPGIRSVPVPEMVPDQ